MTGCPPDEPTLNLFIQEIDQLPPRPHHTGLIELAGRRMPDCRLRFALSRGGWYRPAGVIRPDGTLLSADLERWVEAEMADCDEDIDAFLERHEQDGLQVTRHAGQTHYFVAAYGPGPAEFLQLEVEELQEVLDRQLINPDAPPDDARELIDPFQPVALAAQPVGHPHYRFRRLTDIRRVASRVAAPIGGVSALQRFLNEWQASAAADKGHFSDHWIVGLREHADRHGNPVLNAAPMSLHARKLKHFHWHDEARGVALGDEIHAFDRAAGYPSAWYFHLVAGALVPRALADHLLADIEQGFSYLSDRDAALLKGWMGAPYSV